MARIGFIGLGHMGLPMAINLIKAGHEVTGYDLAQDAVNALIDSGGVKASTIQEVAYNQIVITMLQTGEQVRSVCMGKQGLLASMPAQSLFVDCSSIDVAASREIHHEAHIHHLQVVDAPVSGGVAGAATATLTFMVGGSEHAFDLAKPVLQSMGKKIIHTGAAGSGQAAKICNNMILGISMIAVSEAFNLAQELGLTPKKLFEVVTNSSGECWAMSHYTPVPGVLDNVPANREYQPGFTAAMMLKDLNLSQTSAASMGVNTPLGAEAAKLYQRFNDQGLGSLDFSAIIKMLKE